MKNLLYIIIIAMLALSCNNNDTPYAFFIAGHSYGKPLADNPGLHPPFINIFDYLNDDEEIEFGILTGDIVRLSTPASWDTVDAQLLQLDKKVYFCPGNHDTYNRELYQSRYGDPYYSFSFMNDLFIILDGNLDRWNISGEQLNFLQNTLKEVDATTGNVFVFVHQLIWWNEHNIFSRVDLNWPPYTPDSTNYWSDIEPLLQNLPADVYLIAGDLGANNIASPVMYYPDRNITYIASGMGSITSDNIIIARVKANKKVTFELISLGDDKSKLGKLEDYILE